MVRLVRDLLCVRGFFYVVGGGAVDGEVGKRKGGRGVWAMVKGEGASGKRVC